MPDYVTLVGAEDVQRAGQHMRSAADDMQQAASTTYEALTQHQRFMDDWLSRAETVLERHGGCGEGAVDADVVWLGRLIPRVVGKGLAERLIHIRDRLRTSAPQSREEAVDD